MGITHRNITNRKGNHVHKKNSRKQQRKQLKKNLGEKSAMVEDVELLSKDQLKKLAKNPLNAIRASGKRKRKMLKRLRHSTRDKSQMEVEAATSSSQAETVVTETGDGEMQVDGADEPV